MDNLSSINVDQQLYVMAFSGGFSCYGFGVLDRKARAVADWLVTETCLADNSRETRRQLAENIRVSALGTAEHFRACKAVMDAGAKFAAQTGKRCNAQLVPALRGKEGRCVSATVYGERVRFTVGKSTGWMPCHLQLHNRRSSGGCALDADAVAEVEE